MTTAQEPCKCLELSLAVEIIEQLKKLQEVCISEQNTVGELACNMAISSVSIIKTQFSPTKKGWDSSKL